MAEFSVGIAGTAAGITVGTAVATAVGTAAGIDIAGVVLGAKALHHACLLYTSPSPRD